MKIYNNFIFFQVWYCLSLTTVFLFMITFVLQDFLSSGERNTSLYLALESIESLCVTFFTLEFVLRFANSPSKKRFLKNNNKYVKRRFVLTAQKYKRIWFSFKSKIRINIYNDDFESQFLPGMFDVPLMPMKTVFVESFVKDIN